MADIQIAEDYATDIEDIDNVMIHLEEKQKKRQHEQITEEFIEIKSRLGKILKDYGLIEGDEIEKENHELDMKLLTDPQFVTASEEERLNSKTIIEEILTVYSELCKEREGILVNIQDSLDAEGGSNEYIEENAESQISVLSKETNIEDVSTEITITIENMNKKTQKLHRLYHKLLQLCINISTNKSNAAPQAASRKAREVNIQKQVIGQFKKLHTVKTDRKEKLDTWKYAANEIVDLLKSVRQEGAGDFEKLESEFKKIFEAFNAQGDTLEETQLKLQKHKEYLQQAKTITEKLRNDNVLLQEDADRFRVQNRKAQLQIQELKGLLEKKEEHLNNTRQKENLLSTGDNLEVKLSTRVLSFKSEDTLSERINTLESQLAKKEYELQVEKQKRNAMEEQMKLQNKQEYGGPRFLGVSNELAITSSVISTKPSQGEQRLATRQESQSECSDCVFYEEEIKKLLTTLKSVQKEKNILLQQLQQISSINKNYDVSSTNKPAPSTENVINEIEITEKRKRGVVPLNNKDDNFSDKFSESKVAEVPIISSSEKDFVSFGEKGELESTTHDNQSIVYRELIVEKSKLITYQDVSTQVDNCCENQEKYLNSKLGESNREKQSFSDAVDKEISSIADKIFGFVKLAGRLMKKRTKSQDTNHHQNDHTEDNQNQKNEQIAHQTIEEEGETINHLDKSEDGSCPQIKAEQTQSQVKSIKKISGHGAPLEENFNNNHEHYNEEQHEIKDNCNLDQHRRTQSKHVKVISLIPPSVHAAEPQHHVKVPKKQSLIHPYYSYEGESMERSWTESGFFDDSQITFQQKESQALWHESNNTKSKWLQIKHGKIHHILRFLGRTAKTKCSYVHQEVENMEKEARTPEEAVVNELSAFAEHAIDLLDVISFALKRVELDAAEEDLECKLMSQMNLSSKGRQNGTS